VHPFIACSVSAFAAGGIDNNFSGRRAGGGIELNRPAFYFERSVDGVKDIRQRERGFALCRSTWKVACACNAQASIIP
jgi:hypothetical protein